MDRISVMRILKVCLAFVCVLVVWYFATSYQGAQKTRSLEGPAVIKGNLNPTLDARHQDLDRSTLMDITASEEYGSKFTGLIFSNLSIRLGANLKFDPNKCPPDSYMLRREHNFVPKHQDCPTLFIVGTRKGGTTSLIQYISKHPDFKGVRLEAKASAGETFYFGTRYLKETWEKYISEFPHGVMSGDSSVENLVHQAVPKRIYSDCGKKVKVVMLLRDPIDRLVSNLLMRIRLHTANMNENTRLWPVIENHVNAFLKAIPGSVNISDLDLPNEWTKFVGLFGSSRNMIHEGLYYVHLMNWLCNFPAENILIIRSEEFFRNPSAILDILIQFLGLRRLSSKEYHAITSRSYNTAQKAVPNHQKLTQTNINFLAEIFRPFNNPLLELLKWDSTEWHK